MRSRGRSMASRRLGTGSIEWTGPDTVRVVCTVDPDGYRVVILGARYGAGPVLDLRPGEWFVGSITEARIDGSDGSLTLTWARPDRADASDAWLAARYAPVVSLLLGLYPARGPLPGTASGDVDKVVEEIKKLWQGEPPTAIAVATSLGVNASTITRWCSPYGFRAAVEQARSQRTAGIAGARAEREHRQR